MKIAVACNENQVYGHFGHCESFCIFDTENGKILTTETTPNPGHKPGFLPNYLADKGAKLIIAGSMGGGAVEVINERNVEVIIGVDGDATDAVQRYLCGELKSTGSVCHEHQHADECGKE
ncbi:MAG: NifB/NifX family molybdenum-iron cluster-binding protein [Eubacteriales bacterium]|nr:NifB/NifX family molybdenum-iron cluster-binding protein [Eubacteriales bacterium]